MEDRQNPMDSLPKELAQLILKNFAKPDSAKKYLSTCRAFYQSFLETKSTFVITAIPSSELDTLRKLLNRSKARQIEVDILFQSPSMIERNASDKMMAILANLTNLTGLKLCRWVVNSHVASSDELEQITYMTALQKLSLYRTTIDTSRLHNLTQLDVESISGDWGSLKKLQDLSLHDCPQQQMEIFLPNVSNLTRLHIGLHDTTQTIFRLPLTTLSQLKYLNVYSWEYHHDELDVKIAASCTTLESLENHLLSEMNLQWISSNTNLTHLGIRLGNSASHEEACILTRLRNIKSIVLYEPAALNLFKHLSALTGLDLSFAVAPEALSAIITQHTALESLMLSYPAALDNLTSLQHLTKLWAFCKEASSFPTTLKDVLSKCEINNLTALTRLESLVLDKCSYSMDNFDAEKFTCLTRLSLRFSEEDAIFRTLPKLSNLFSLQSFAIYANPRPTNNIPLDFLTTLTNLESLTCNSVTEMDPQLLENLTSSLTRLTSLQVKCCSGASDQVRAKVQKKIRRAIILP